MAVLWVPTAGVAQATCNTFTVGPGTYTTNTAAGQVGCQTALASTATIVGNVTGATIIVNNPGPALNGILAQTSGNAANPNPGGANITVDNTTILNTNTTLASIGINVVVGVAGIGSSNGILTLTGTNVITTTNGGGILVNVRGAGNASADISGFLLINNLSDNSDGQDGIEVTSRSGSATLVMTDVDATVNVRGGNGIFVNSLTQGALGGGNVSATIGSDVKVNLDNTNSGTAFSNAGIRVATTLNGTVDLTTAARIRTIGDQANGITSVTAAGQATVSNAGDITTNGISSHGIQATSTSGSVDVTNTGIIVTTAAASDGIQGITGTGTVAINNSGSITSGVGNGVFVLSNATITNAGTIAGGSSAVRMNGTGNRLNLTTGSVLTGDVFTAIADGNTIHLQGTGSEDSNFGGAGFESLVMEGTQWTLTGDLRIAGTAPDAIAVNSGLLTMAGSVTNLNGGGINVAGGTLRAGVVNAFGTNSPVNVGSAGTLDLAGFNQTVASLVNAGTIRMSATPTSTPGTVLTVNGSYLGNGGVIEMNTVLGDDNSATDKLVINGGNASGSTVLRFTNVGGQGAQTTNGIRVVETTNGGTTTPTAFSLGGQRYTAGAYEYLLERTGQDWFLTSRRNNRDIFRDETPGYGPIPAIGRSLGLFTVRTLHERVGEEENLRGQAESRSLLNGIWARALGEHQTNSFTGAGDPSVDGNFWGGQLGLDLYRHTTDGGSRNHLGVLGSYTGFRSSSVRGDARGELDTEVGEIEMRGPSAGLYWTHFGPGGWYLDAVAQESWSNVKATAQTTAPSGSRLETDLDGLTASLETGYPIHLGSNGMWLVEPQAQVIWQGFRVDRYPGASSPSTGAPSGIVPESSTVEWTPADVWTGRLGVRIQQSCKCADGPLWQRYGRVNVWHEFNAADGIAFDGENPILVRSGGTALEGGLGMTAKASQLLSVYGEATYRHSVGGARHELTGVHGTLGARLNW
ncbi:MAG: autotransporter outer membrane beta-barrel domain-containing protein [Gemmatimonadota bacterium]|nr:autotransporter outer membrane beta-barrel domain-containing protein [Gemmatimonadota bacterium]